MKPIEFISSEEPEWNAMWERLKTATGDKDYMAENEASGEVWQYMGTYDGYHEFRHRHHPKTDKREYKKIIDKRFI
jgi:hypothetical protein